jgi:hypothetical protein
MPSSASSGRAPGLQRSGRPSDICGRSDHSQWFSPLRVTEPSAGGRRGEGAPRRAGARDAPAARAPAAGPPGRRAPGAPVLMPRRRRRTAEVGAPRPRGRDPGGGHRACRLAGQGRRRDRLVHGGPDRQRGSPDRRSNAAPGGPLGGRVDVSGRRRAGRPAGRSGGHLPCSPDRTPGPARPAVGSHHRDPCRPRHAGRSARPSPAASAVRRHARPGSRPARRAGRPAPARRARGAGRLGPARARPRRPREHPGPARPAPAASCPARPRPPPRDWHRSARPCRPGPAAPCRSPAMHSTCWRSWPWRCWRPVGCSCGPSGPLPLGRKEVTASPAESRRGGGRQHALMVTGR